MTQAEEMITQRVAHTFTFEDDRKNSEDEGTTYSGVESSPIVAHCEVAGSYLNTEQHTWKKHIRVCTTGNEMH